MFIPIRDDNPCKTFPIVTVALIIINASIFLVSRKFNPFAAPSLHFSNFFSFMPIEFTGDLLRVGSPRPVWLSLFTSMFMLFIPIRDDNPCKTFPIVTVALIIINASIFLVSRKFNPFAAPSLHFSNFFSFMPIEFTGDLLRVGSPRPVWLSLFTSMFMHANLWHLIGNIWYLWLFGNRVEVRYGRTAFLTLYLMWGVSAASLHLLISSDPAVATVGASGAIAGVLGSYMLLFPKATIGGIWPLFYVFLPGELPAVIVLGQWFLLQLLAFQPGVAYLAHIGGFVAGMITALLFLACSFILKRDMEGCTGSPYVEEIEDDSTVLPPKE